MRRRCGARSMGQRRPRSPARRTPASRPSWPAPRGTSRLKPTSTPYSEQCSLPSATFLRPSSPRVRVMSPPDLAGSACHAFLRWPTVRGFPLSPRISLVQHRFFHVFANPQPLLAVFFHVVFIFFWFCSARHSRCCTSRREQIVDTLTEKIDALESNVTALASDEPEASEASVTHASPPRADMVSA
jgi:hypothetical protein